MRTKEIIEQTNERRNAIYKFVEDQGGSTTGLDIINHFASEGYDRDTIRRDLTRLQDWVPVLLVNESVPGNGRNAYTFRNSDTIVENPIILHPFKEGPSSMKNSEGYPDPTASKAINTVDWTKIDGNADVRPGDIWWLKTITKTGEAIERFLVIATFDDGGTVGFTLKEYKNSDIGYMSTNCYKFKVVSQKADELIDVYVQLHRIKNVPAYILTKMPFDGWIDDEDLMRIRSYVLKAYKLLPKDDQMETLTERIHTLEEENQELMKNVSDTCKLEGELMDKSSTIESLNETIENLDKTIDKLVSELDEEAENNLALTSQNNEMLKTINELNEKIAELEENILAAEPPISMEVESRAAGSMSDSDKEFYQSVIEKLIAKL